MQDQDGTYRFVALDPRDDTRSVSLNIVASNERSVQQLRKVWLKMYTAMRGYHETIDSAVAPGWVHWKPDEWCEDKRVKDRRSFAAWAGDTLVGFLNIRPGYTSLSEPDEKLVYIEHISTAPGNLSTDVWGQRLMGVGTCLTAFAILQSVRDEYGGRIALHASDPMAARYYDDLMKKHRLFLPPRTGIPGTPEDKRAPQRFYYESNPEHARTFLEGYRHE